MSDSCTHSQHTQEGSTTFYNTALGDQNERQLHTFKTHPGGINHPLQQRSGRPERTTVTHFETTQGVGQPPSTTPLWEARTNDSCTH